MNGTIMGSSCSAQRSQRRRENSMDGMSSANGGSSPEGESSSRQRSTRHSVVSMVPDDNIAALYPIEDNYVLDPSNNKGSPNTRSPKSLVALCTDVICRSLPHLEGDIPPGLPQDVVDDVFASLVQHSALNATTLRALKHCEVRTLPLAGCRGVTDEWLTPLMVGASFGSSSQSEEEEDDNMEFEDSSSSASDSSQTFHSATSNHHHHHPEASSHALPDTDDLMEHASSSMDDTSVPSDPQGSAVHDQAMSVATPPVNPCSFSLESATAPSPPPAPAPPIMTSTLTVLDLRGSTSLTDKGLGQLRDLHSLEICRLDGCHHLSTGKGLSLALSQSHRLHTLSLSNCRRLQDEAIQRLSRALAPSNSLENVTLGGCRCLTDRSLHALSTLTRLRKLDLSQCDLVTDGGMEALEDLVFLQELSLGWCRSISDDGLNTLTSQTTGRAHYLQVLRLARCNLTDEGIQHVARLKALQELDLNGCNSISSAVLGDVVSRLPHFSTLDVSYCAGILRSSWQGKIPRVKTLELCYSGVRDGHLARLTSLPALEELNLDSCPVGDWAISHLADNNVTPNLRALDLADTDLTDLGMVHLPKFKNLTKLSLFYCNITNSGLRHLSGMTTLEVLNLDSRDVGDDGMQHLRDLPKLRALDVFSGRVTDTGCVHLAKIKSLESLELCGGGIGDLGCTILAATLENLTSLNLSQNERITNRGAAALAALTKLKALNLSNTRVTSNALRFFSGLVGLQSLALYGCRGMSGGAAASASTTTTTSSSPHMDALLDSLPKLKCLRLNHPSSERDGRMSGVDLEEEDDNEDSDEEDDDFPTHILRQRVDSLVSFASDDGGVAMQQEDDASLYSDE